MRIKWIPFPGETQDKDRWIIVVRGGKPKFVNEKVEKCIAAILLLCSQNGDLEFFEEDLINSLVNESSYSIKRVLKTLKKEKYIQKVAENRYKLSKRIFHEIDISHFLASITDA